MNISEAKEYIKQSVKIYLKKDEFGDYRIPVVRQRPIFLLGAPGIGKTAIMEQIAAELDIALVAYSMTHHTRQSALGLPFIKQKQYGDKVEDVSEYTMSEIIASVYDTMEESGVKEGILFLDEINCVSETLAPSMLQFLQYKVFGRHQVPEGWVIVTAGNPPEYNKSVREFDVVTMDRLKVLSVEADYATWKKYAKERSLHSAILNFLDGKKEYFYHMETTVKGRSYVTARGWEDLSEIIVMYEEEGMPVDENLVSQYLQNDTIVKEFCAYYDLYNKYKNDYRVEEILSGHMTEALCEKAKKADFDERLSLTGLFLERVEEDMKNCVMTSDYLSSLMQVLRKVKDAEKMYEALQEEELALERQLYAREKAGALLTDQKKSMKSQIRFLQNCKKDIYNMSSANAHISDAFDKEVQALKEATVKTGERIHYMFQFAEEAFGQGNELLIMVTDLTVNDYCARYLTQFGSDDYYKFNEILMLSQRQNNMKQKIENLKL